MPVPRYVPRHLRAGEESAEVEREPLGNKRVEVSWRRSFNKTETKRVKAGVTAVTTDDRWEAVFDEETATLSLYRSWSGICMFALELADSGKGCETVTVWMNADASQLRANAEQAVGIIERLVGELADGSVQAERQQAVEVAEEPVAVRVGRFARSDDEATPGEAPSAERLLASMSGDPTSE